MTTGISYRGFPPSRYRLLRTVFAACFITILSAGAHCRAAARTFHTARLLLDHRKSDDRVRFQHGVWAERDFYNYSVQQDDDGMGRRCFVNK